MHVFGCFLCFCCCCCGVGDSRLHLESAGRDKAVSTDCLCPCPHTPRFYLFEKICFFCVFCPNFLTKRLKTGCLSVKTEILRRKRFSSRLGTFENRGLSFWCGRQNCNFPITGWHHSRYNHRWYIAGATEACACATDNKKVRKKSGNAKASFD